ncbi:hypothetical protein EYF80_040372 [Liparis tanakae]|uniref:Uncharacterized protein n=1 Tax=Liparis tanakae TaxID=230148 RepID=A0A4Z2G782_9TELE|nr:hypothetical protein EYF80_040372 [Liparis tanakae]
MFVSVWHAKKMGSRFLDNVRKAKRRRHHAMSSHNVTGGASVLRMGMSLGQKACTCADARARVQTHVHRAAEGMTTPPAHIS